MTDARARDRDDDESGAGSPAGGGTATMRSGTGRAAARPERTQAPNGKAPDPTASDRKAPDPTAPVSPAAGPSAAAGRRRQAVATDRPDERMRLRPVIEHLRPEVDGGRFPAKAAVGDDVVVGADVFADGHDLVVRA